MKIRPFAGIIAIILVSSITLCSCNIIPAGDSGIVTGYVKLEDGISPKDVQVSLSGYDLDYVSYAVNPDENGYFRIEDVYPYTYTVSYYKNGYYKETKEQVSVSAGKTVNLETVTLSAKYGFFTGKVTDESGTPLSDAKVTVSGNGRSYSANSGSDGSFKIKAKIGKYTDITISAINPCRYLQETLSKSVSLDKETNLDSFTLMPDTHNYVLTSMVESSATKAGYREYSCTNCKDEYTDPIPKRTDGARWAGIRASSYGLEESFGSYPSVNEMTGYIEKMESCYSGSNGTVVLIVGVVSGRDDFYRTCFLDFPLSKEINNAVGSDVDLYENYLSAMDNAGYSVWLQVEPGYADLEELATEVMKRYKHHSCVKGFGIDVEWYKRSTNRKDDNKDGTALDKTTANRVLKAIQKINPSYTIFVKHWVAGYLTEGEPVEGFIYIDDSQIFKSLSRMCEDFASWAENFDPCPVMFQIGYDSDEWIWSQFENPAKQLGQTLLSECNTDNDKGIIWVDFTLKEVIEKID